MSVLSLVAVPFCAFFVFFVGLLVLNIKDAQWSGLLGCSLGVACSGAMATVLICSAAGAI